MAPDSELNKVAVQRILDAISHVNITLARVEARIDNLMRDTKDHEGRIRVLEHDQVDVKLLRTDANYNRALSEGHTADVKVLTMELDVLKSDRDSVRGFIRAIAVITPVVSGVVTGGIMLLSKGFLG